VNTTNVFVELLVVGLGPLTFILLLFALALGPDASARGVRERRTEPVKTAAISVSQRRKLNRCRAA
jgi:hypothetical protein